MASFGDNSIQTGVFEMIEQFGEVLTTTEVIKYLKVSRKTLLKLVRGEKIPARKVGKDYRYLKSEIEKFLRGEMKVNYFQ
jgi:excisionase family DNA binding protein